MKKTDDPEALRQVWVWKEEAYREVESLDLLQGLRKRMEDSLKTTRRLGLTMLRPSGKAIRR